MIAAVALLAVCVLAVLVNRATHCPLSARIDLEDAQSGFHDCTEDVA